jgi:hypothetical protein
VLSPQIEHLDNERALLERTLTFRSETSTFERLLPLQAALFPEARHVFEDLHGELPQYDQLVADHDQQLGRLLKHARELFSALLGHVPFTETFQRVLDEAALVSGVSIPQPSDHDMWLRWIAADVVNDLAADLPPQYSDWYLWNHGAVRFKAAAPAELLLNVGAARAEFAQTVSAVRSGVFGIRKRLSRQYDVPVVPGGGAQQ